MQVELRGYNGVYYWLVKPTFLIAKDYRILTQHESIVPLASGEGVIPT